MDNNKINIIEKINIKESEFVKDFNILKNNLSALNMQISEDDFDIWFNNNAKRLRTKESFWLDICTDGELNGFICIDIIENQLYVSELQLDNKLKSSFAILRVIEKIIDFDHIKKYNEIYFNINKSNEKSKKTFLHLGATIVSEKQNSIKYKLTRESVESYFKKIYRKNK